MRQLKITPTITNRENKAFRQYLEELTALPETPLTAQEEVVLMQKIREDKCVKSKEILIKSNLRFVVSVAKQYQSSGIPLIDLVSEGNIGLIKAAERFDETRGFKFISYAVWWIRQTILQSLADDSRAIRLPLNKVGDYNKIIRAQRELEFTLEREPSTQEIADELEISIKDVESVLASQSGIMSLDADLVKGDEGTSLMDVLYDKGDDKTDHLLKDEDAVKRVKMILSRVSDREKYILENYYGLNGCQENTLQSISDELGLTRERARQIKEKALKKIRARITRSNEWLLKD